MRQSRLLYTQDISKKKDRLSRNSNRCLDTSDIDGSQPRRNYEGLSKSCAYLNNEDIEGAKVKPMHFRAKVASVDKPQKSYIHPCYLPKEPEVLPFRRDTLFIDVNGL